MSFFKVLSPFREAFEWCPSGEIRARLEECREKMAASAEWLKAAYGGMFGGRPPDVAPRDLSALLEAFLELLIAGRPRRLTVALYDDTPRCSENFQRLCEQQKLLGSVVHRVVPRCLIEAGDVLKGNGTAGQSAFGPSFQEEPLERRLEAFSHHKRGLVAMIPSANGYDSRFRITLRALPELSGLVFGEVKNAEVLEALEQVETVYPDRPKETIRVVQCGVKTAHNMIRNAMK